MSETSKTVITLGADVGGKDAHEATHAHILAFRRLLSERCTGPYSNTIKEIALVLRIDGAIQSWGKQGVEGVALQKKNSFATADIYVPRESWASVDGGVFRSFLAVAVKEAICAVAGCASGKGVDLNAADLDRDVAAAALSFQD
ncbi:hypothetical protein [Paucibacter sp. B51]|uniref:hypothetical protein n=1 Tax=Paucibacter sp. B51 TaxID=2993315 RepID=UPI0022EBB41B|nr:hypothetical protein [Paucibacter sp. B51]